MKARLLDLSLGFDGKQRLTVELDGDFRDSFDDLHEKDVDVTVKIYRRKRSLEANAYAWVLIGKIAEKKHIRKTEVYRNAIRDIGGVSEIITIKKSAFKRLQETWMKNGIGWQVDEIKSTIPGWTNAILYYGSSSYTTAQMSDLISSLIQDAQSLGIETKSPEDIHSMLNEYNYYRVKETKYA